MRIYITRQIPEIGLNLLREKGYDIDQNPDDRPLTKEEIISVLKGKEYDAVISMLTDKIDSDVFSASPSTKIFSNYAVGFNNIDIDEAKNKGVVVTNTPGDLTDSVAEHSVALLLSLLNKVVLSDKFIRSGRWTGFDPDIFLRDDFKGKVVGIVGAGRIGLKFGKILHYGFDSKIIYYDVKRNEDFEREVGAEFKENVEDVLRESDIVSLNVPLMESTTHLLNKERISLMKKNSILINTSRGGVVDEMALVEALKNKEISGAGLDVFEFEPNLSEGLKDLDNVVLTPHIASATYKARNDMAVLACQNLIDFFEGKELKNKVN